jgi:hypothetical protein
MSKRFFLTEDEKREIRKNYFFEQSENSDKKDFCHSGNVKDLSDLIGDDDASDYIEGVKLRKGGLNGIVDRLELLKTIRLHPNITDGGEHLAFEVMNNLKSFKPYKYFDETKKECCRAMDKIIELYKENEHGEELVKDIEKVYASQRLSPRAKEFLKHGISMIKGD